MNRQQPCRYGAHCRRRSTCAFLHPDDAEPEVGRWTGFSPERHQDNHDHFLRYGEGTGYSNQRRRSPSRGRQRQWRQQRAMEPEVDRSATFASEERQNEQNVRRQCKQDTGRSRGRERSASRGRQRQWRGRRSAPKRDNHSRTPEQEPVPDSEDSSSDLDADVALDILQWPVDREGGSGLNGNCGENVDCRATTGQQEACEHRSDYDVEEEKDSDDGSSESSLSYDMFSQDSITERVFDLSDSIDDLLSALGICPNGKNCTDLLCRYCDPYRRLECPSGALCWNKQCPNVHPEGWSVCDKGVSCCDYKCSSVHPEGRTPKCKRGMRCGNADCEDLHPDGWSEDSEASSVALKSPEERELDRRKAGLPMLAHKNEFVRRLKEEGVLVVTAETGSGKTTQLSQYAAEAFEGKIVCTQPRALAAIMVAQRVATEFDGASVGHNVGYQVGGHIVRGRKVMIVTDAALVRMAQVDPRLDHVGVLIIDEAHERSLNTDIVAGIAKKIRQQRPQDFRVVISSATMDPKPFLEFFFSGSDHPAPLKISGRMFPVPIEWRHVTDDPDDIGNLLAEEVVQTLRDQPQGHCLVFLQGAREVERAITEFKKASPSPLWVPLPLHGALPPEEQRRVMTFDDQGDKRRMIVFCTNVAETSLTVPGVRVVIDTGLAKEARYDPQRRMNILEQVYVSRSSAEQRRGRAGRTQDGHCVRLYREDKLDRESIQPEILRSSLDQVVLQLCGLNYDPLTFDFIDRPDSGAMLASLELLRRLNCIDEAFGLKERGRLFNKLPFDPRLSHFVLEAYERGHGGVAVEIAAILSAPGSVRFFGKNTKSDNALQNVEHFSSDLIYLRSLYRGWFDAGTHLDVVMKGNATCGKCHRKWPPSVLQKNGGCRPCRVVHSLANGLNNKVLDIVRGTIDTVQKVLANRRADLATMTVDEVIGRCLAEAFPEQIGEFLLPSNPDVGIHLIETDLKAALSLSSTMFMRRPDARFVLPMKVTKLPSGRLIVDQVHHVQLDWLPDDVQCHVQKSSLCMTQCYRKVNVHSRFRTHCFKYFQKLADDGGDPRANFVVTMYDAPSCALTVYAPQSNAPELGQVCRVEMERLLDQELQLESVVTACNGSVELTVTAGMVVRKVSRVAQATRVTFTNPPVRSESELLDWLCKKTGAKRTDVKKCKLTRAGEGHTGVVDFRDAKTASMAKTLCPSVASTESLDQCAVLLKTHVKNPEVLLEQRGIKPLKVVVLKTEFSNWLVKISNVPENLGEKRLQALLSSGQRFYPPPVRVRNSRVFNGTYFSNLVYPDEDSCTMALNWLQNVPQLNQSFSITIPCKNGGHRSKTVKTTASCEPPKSGAKPAEYLMMYESEAQAEKLYNLRYTLPDLQMEGNSAVRVDHWQKYDVEKHAKAIAGAHDVRFKMGPRKGVFAKVYFCNGPPSRCLRAARALRSLVTPIRHRFADREKQVMAEELHSSDLPSAWAVELNLDVEYVVHEKRVTGMVIYGEQYRQGQFMARLADYYSSFKKRYHLKELPSSAGCLFRQGCVGDARLKELNERFRSKSCELTFLYRSNVIEIVVQPDAKEKSTVLLQQCNDAIEKILKDCHQPSVDATSCAYCTQRPGAPFSICGHKHCKDCLEQVVIQVTSTMPFRALRPQEVPSFKKRLDEAVRCPTCSTAISIRDIESSLRKSSLEDLCTAVALLYVSSAVNCDLAICPASNCRGLVPKAQEYAPCPLCNTSVCPRCGAVSDPRHSQRSCADYRDLLELSVTIAELAAKAEEFAREHWKNCCGNQPDITRVDVNPGLQNGCESLQRYCKGIDQLGVEHFARSTVFGWHGTAETAIAAICDQGFDPKRRSGQVHGPGEYFGISAQVSMGYTKGVNRLIVSQIIKAPGLFHQEGTFCYVVNNPTDWSAAFNLPVLVVSFGPPSPVPWVVAPKRPLPNPFFDPPPQPPPLEAAEVVTDGGLLPKHAILSDLGVATRWQRSLLVVTDPTRKWVCAFQWHWSADGGRQEPYSDGDNVQIERKYLEYKWGGGPASFDLSQITRYVDHRAEAYTIDFARSMQINRRTHYQRSISRVKARSSACIKWKFYDQTGEWKEWNPTNLVENVYQKYLEGRGSGIDTVATFEGRFEVDFVSGTRRNLITGSTEQVWRKAIPSCLATSNSTSDSSTVRVTREPTTASFRVSQPMTSQRQAPIPPKASYQNVFPSPTASVSRSYSGTTSTTSSFRVSQPASRRHYQQPERKKPQERKSEGCTLL